MKNPMIAIVLAVLCVGLAVVLGVSKKNAATEHAKATESILLFSNNLFNTTEQLTEQRQVNVLLTNDLASRDASLVTLTNQVTEISTTLAKTETDLKARDAKITELENRNRELDQQATDLSTAITNLNTQIADTQHKLAVSEGDKEFLKKELDTLMAQKAELERRFNDIVVLRAQVSKLREEMNVARRLDWLRKGLFGAGEKKGAEQLMQLNSKPNPTPADAEKSAQKYDLNVEVNSDGTLRSISPLTNRPAAP